MRDRARLALLAFLCIVSAPVQVGTAAGEPSQLCDSVESCITELTRAAGSRRHVGEPVRARLLTFGDAAVDALVPLLMHEDLWVRESAGLSLAGFRRIDPRHLAALVHAWRRGDTINSRGRGNGWLARPIAATRTEEALRLLWQDFLRDPEHSSNAQVFFALGDMGDRIRPLLLDRFAACRESANGDECRGIYSLLDELRPPYPMWSVEAIVGLVGHARSDEVRYGAETQLARLRHLAALAPLQRRLAALSPDEVVTRDREWEVQDLIALIERYGGAAAASGPVLAHYLDSRFSEDLRADAALALGRIEDVTAVPALQALEPDLTDDWLLAYNVAESLGRLRASEARTLLERLDDHWHRGVRNNAARAMSAIAGGAFARPDVPGDGRPYPAPRDEEGTEYFYFGDLRFAGDDASSWCGTSADERSWTLEQNPVARIRWPRRGSARLAVRPPDEVTASEIRRRIPVRQVQGEIVAVLPVRSGQLIAFNGGEFGGGLYHLPDQGSARPLFGEPVDAVWLMGGRLYVAAGLAHLVLDRGHLYVVDPVQLGVERIVRLPASPHRLVVSGDRVVLIETRAGDVAVQADGTVVDALRIGDCDEE